MRGGEEERSGRQRGQAKGRQAGRLVGCLAAYESMCIHAQHWDRLVLHVCCPHAAGDVERLEVPRITGARKERLLRLRRSHSAYQSEQEQRQRAVKGRAPASLMGACSACSTWVIDCATGHDSGRGGEGWNWAVGSGKRTATVTPLTD